MMTQQFFPIRRVLLTGAACITLAAGLATAPALEPRTWISLDGRTLDAELIRVEGDIVELKDKEGRTLKVPKSSLSFGDHDYIREYAPEDTSKALGGKSTGKPKVPNPAREMKFDRKKVKKDAGEIKLGGLTFKVCESPHFKVFCNKAADPVDTAELAERLWHDTAFFHSSFAAKFKDRRMAIIMADSEKEHAALGEWYAETLIAAKNTEGADNVRRTWALATATQINLPAEMADNNGLLNIATVIKVAGRGQTGGDNGKGVWASFRTHVLAGDLIGIQAGGTASFAKEGIFAVFTGHSFFKEIDLTGATTTSIIVTDDAKKSSTAGGYDTGRNWASELKRRIRKGDVKPRLVTLFRTDSNMATPDDLAMAYSFSRFLQSTPERHTAYNKLMERVSTSRQVPDPDGVARIYGLEDGNALEKEWLAFVDSGDFR